MSNQTNDSLWRTGAWNGGGSRGLCVLSTENSVPGNQLDGAGCIMKGKPIAKRKKRKKKEREQRSGKTIRT
jgi:hypothetical protein